jgi:CDP-4-dehydro-6-deoxyglucose reductase, E3
MAGPISTRLLRQSTLATDVLAFVFEILAPTDFTFCGGQFVTLSVGKDALGQPIRRSYSIASSPDDGKQLRLIVKLTAEGPAGGFFRALKLGDTIEMTGPHGFFVLDRSHPGDVVFAATGTGIAPVLPFLTELAGRKEIGQRFLHWGIRSEADLFGQDELEKLCSEARCKLSLHLSAPSGPWKGDVGRINQPVLDRLPMLHAPTFYLVGNGAMIRELKAALMAQGIDRKRQIRSEPFFD